MKILSLKAALVIAFLAVALAPAGFAQNAAAAATAGGPATTSSGAGTAAATPITLGGPGASNLAADLPGHDEPAVTLTASEAIRRAEANQPLIEQAQNEVRAAEAGVGLAQSSYYPRVVGSGSYTLLEPNQSFSFGPFPPIITQAETFSLVPENNFDFHVGANEVIYQFGQRGIQVRLAKSGVAAAQIGIEQIRSSLAYETAQSFYAVLLLGQEVRALDEQLSDLTQHLAAIQKKEQTGSATIYDVLSTEVRVAAMKSQRIEAENSYQKQLIGLKELIGLEPGRTLDLSGSFSPAPRAGSPEALLSQAFAQRTELAQQNEAVKSAELSLKLAKAEGLPSVSAYAQAGYKTGLLPSINQLTFTWDAGAQVNVPIFAGLQRVKAIEQAQAKLAAAQSALASARQKVTTQVLQAYQDRQASAQQVGTSLVQLTQAEQMLKVAKVQYDLGTVTNLDYLDSESSLEQARLAHLTALYHEVIADLTLKSAAGERIWSVK